MLIYMKKMKTDKKKFEAKVSSLVQGIMAQSEMDNTEDFILSSSASKSVMREFSKNFIASINLGQISYEFWRSGSKIQMIKAVLPGLRTAERDENTSFSKEQAIQEIVKIVLNAMA
jgi:hypothetical protein